MAKTFLQGKDGKVATASKGAAVTTGTLTADAMYIVKTIGGSTALPSGVEIGYPFVADGTEDITASGDEVYLVTESDQCNISSWNMEFSSDEIDITTLCDEEKQYLSGLPDISGSVEGIYKVGTSDIAGGFQNKFVTIVSQADAGGTVTISDVDGDPIYLILYVQKDGSSGETVGKYIVPAVLTSYSNGAVQGEKQTFSTNFRPTDDADINLSYFKLVVA